MDLTMPSTKLDKKLAPSWRFEALGTQWEVASSRPLSQNVETEITNLIERFDAVYSRFRADSTVRLVAKKPGEYTFPDSIQTLLGLYDELYVLTDGKVTPLVGKTLETAGYDEHYSLKPSARIAGVPNYDEVVSRHGTEVTLKEPVLLDFGAAGKGQLVDLVVTQLLEFGHTDFIVDASGDLRIVGEWSEQIGLEDPRDSTQVIGAMHLSNKALCASAVNRRVWGDWHHVVDPHTKLPTKEIIATWVVADTALLADGLATALFFTSPQTLATKYTYEYVRVHASGAVEYSDYFAKGMFS